MNITQKTMMLAAAALVGGIAFADELPFWGVNSPATNRICSASASRTIASFTSCDYSVRTEVLADFDSTKCGAVIIIR